MSPAVAYRFQRRSPLAVGSSSPRRRAMTQATNRGRGWRRWLTAFVLSPWVALNALADAGIELAPGWRYQIYARDLIAVDNLAVAADGSVFASLERTRGRGQVVRIRNGAVDIFIDKLNRPDGLYLHGKRWYVAEEVADGRVLEVDLDTGRRRAIATLRNPEGIARDRDGHLLVSEDNVNGRIVRLMPGGRVDTLIGGLNRPEGICLAGDGELYIAETATGRVLAYHQGAVRTVVEDLDAPDQIRLAVDGALWITEDSSQGRLLRLRDGQLDVIAAGLSRPQGIAFLAGGQVLVAEQGRNRILRFSVGSDKNGRAPAPN